MHVNKNATDAKDIRPQTMNKGEQIKEDSNKSNKTEKQKKIHKPMYSVHK